MKINYLKNTEIDFEAYDNCITQSSQNRIYALSWYLNIMSTDWELLMADDYNFVMPIPVKRKFLFRKEIVQSSGCQQLGIFSTKELDGQIFNDFINAIPAKSFVLKFNSDNIFPHPRAKMGVSTNYILNLNQSYENIRLQYKKERIRALETTQNVILEKNNNVEPYWTFISENRNSSRDAHNLDKFEFIFKEAAKRGLLEVWTTKNNKNVLQAVACFVKWGNRVYYFFPASINQQFLSNLLDKYIQENAGNDLILDFVASSSPISARFIESFGAVFEPYPSLTKK